MDKIIIRHSNNHPLNFAYPPTTLPSVPDSHSIFMRDAELLQVTDSDTGILPLFPDHCSESTEYLSIK